MERWMRPKDYQMVFSSPGEGEDSILIGVRSRDPPSIIASATSSNASVATTSSTTGLLGIKVKKYLKGQHRADRMTQKELNILLAGQPGLEPGDKKTTELDLEQPSAATQPTEESPGSLFKQVLAALAVSLCSLVVGFASAYTAPALASMNSPNSTLHITDAEASWIGSLMPLSALFGGICGGPMIENLGRRNTILSTGLPFSLSFLLISFATNVGMVMAGRSLAGFCVGISSLALPVYLGETVEPRVRGTLGLLPTTLGNLGILFAFTAGAFLNWSDLALLGAVLPLPYFICTFFVPETPGWYVSRGNDKKAQESLQWLRGQNVDISAELAQFNKSHKDIEHHDAMTTLKELFSKRYYWPFCISLGLMFFQQFSGINAVIFYTVNIFRDAGSTIDSNLSSIIVGIVNLISTMLATVLIDKLGRKILLYVSNTLMALTLGVLGTFFYFKSTDMDMTEYGWVPLPAFMVFIFGFAVGAGPIPWLMMGEILPAQVRGTAASIVTAFNWSCTFIVTKTFIDMSRALGTHSAFFMFSLICIFGLAFVIKSVPETKGKSLEDIERNLVPGVSRVSMRTLARIPSLAYLKPFPSVY